MTEAEVPDRARYRAAIVAGTLQAEILAACERAWAWLELGADARETACAETIRTEAAARWQLQALPFVRRRLFRDAGIDPDDEASAAAFFEAIDRGEASPAQIELAQRLTSSLTIASAVTALFPDAALSPAAPDPQQEALLERTAPLIEAMHACETGLATPATLDRLHAAIATFDAAGVGAGAPVAREQAWWIGLAWCAAGRIAGTLGRHDACREAYEQAMESYSRAKDSRAAAQCAERLRDLATQRLGDFDSAADREWSAILMARDPLGRARALTRLVRETAHAGDHFEAARLAEEAANTLTGAGYPDPERGFGAATRHWVAHASEQHTGNTLVAHLCELAEYWAVVLGARTSARIETDPVGSAQAELVLRSIAPWTAELIEQADRAEAEVALRFAQWNPTPQSSATGRGPVDGSIEGSAALSALADALLAVRADCNECADPQQLGTVRVLRARAEALGSRFHVASAFLEEAYVLLALQRPAEAAQPARQAIATLLANEPVQLAAFGSASERELYLNAIAYQAHAPAAAKDWGAVIVLCEPVLRELEDERRRVNSPYQRSAFLGSRTVLYEFVAIAAYHTRRIGLLIEVSEMLKAPPLPQADSMTAVPASVADPSADLRAVNEALDGVTPGSSEEHELQERRQWLFARRAIARARAGGAATQITLAALQRQLGPDEAAISWFWIGTGALIVFAVTEDRTSQSVVSLTDSQQSDLDDYLDCVRPLAGTRPGHARLIAQLDALIDRLGPVLLPDPIRSFIEGRSRLILCPHRSLHLFAFHALPSDGRPLIEKHAVRYVPSLSSLLQPWHGNTSGPTLAVGVTHFDDPELPALPAAAREATEVAALYGTQGRALLDATCAQFKSASQETLRCLHIATHGSSVLAGSALDDPLDCRLYLRDGTLSGWDLSTLDLSAEVVVLASCHSAQRSIGGRGLEQLPGDDLFGLPAILREAGVGHLLGTLWPAEDATTHAIVCDFHRGYAQGMAPDLALQNAVRVHLGDPDRRQPAFFWAPFTLNAFGGRNDDGS